MFHLFLLTPSIQQRGFEFVDDYVKIVKNESCASSFFSGENFLYLGDEIILRSKNVSQTIEEYEDDPCVLEVEPFLIKKRAKKNVCTDPNVQYQTHLQSSNIVRAWEDYHPSRRSFVFVLDEGIHEHQDIDVFVRYQISSSSFNGSHALAVAGIVGAKWNGIGCCGISNDVSIVDVNLLATTLLSDVTESIAFSGPYASWNGVFCNAWGPVDDGRCENMGRLLNSTIHTLLERGRDNKGAIIVFASGNGGIEENVNDDGYASHVGVIAVSVVSRNSHFAIGEWGSCITLSATGKNVLTLASRDSYAFMHGSSAASPIVSGVISLLIAKFPDLGWRDVQDILILSAGRTNDVYEFSASGRRYSYLVGAGIVDAAAAMQLAKVWEPLPAWQWVVERMRVQDVTPFAGGILISRKLIVEKFKLCIRSTTNGVDGSKMEIQVISPEGTASILTMETSRVSQYGCSYDDKCFSSLKSWGETSMGMWSYSVRSAETAELDIVTLTVYGHQRNHVAHSCRT